MKEDNLTRCNESRLEQCALTGVLIVTADNEAFERLARLAAPWAEVITLPREKTMRIIDSIAERAAAAPGVILRVKHISHKVSEMIRAKNNNVIIIDNGRIETLIDALERVNHGYEESPQVKAAPRCQASHPSSHRRG